MEIDWCIYDADVEKVIELVRGQAEAVISHRIEKNIEHEKLELNHDGILRSLLFSLLISGKRAAPSSKILSLFQIEPFPFQYSFILKSIDKKEYVYENLKKNGIVGDINKVPDFFAINFDILENSGWNLLNTLRIATSKDISKSFEREIADNIDIMFKGFGATEARIFLLSLGITKFEIPIGTILTEWLNNFGFPVKISSTALQDRNFYHFISDGIQLLCERANIYPCVLEAAIQCSMNSKGIGEYLYY